MGAAGDTLPADFAPGTSDAAGAAGLDRLLTALAASRPAADPRFSQIAIHAAPKA